MSLNIAQYITKQNRLPTFREDPERILHYTLCQIMESILKTILFFLPYDLILFQAMPCVPPSTLWRRQCAFYTCLSSSSCLEWYLTVLKTQYSCPLVLLLPECYTLQVVSILTLWSRDECEKGLSVYKKRNTHPSTWNMVKFSKYPSKL